MPLVLNPISHLDAIGTAPLALDVIGTTAFYLDGHRIGGGTVTLTAIDISTPASPAILSFASFSDGNAFTQYAIDGTNYYVLVKGSQIVYVFDISDPSSLNLATSYSGTDFVDAGTPPQIGITVNAIVEGTDGIVILGVGADSEIIGGTPEPGGPPWHGEAAASQSLTAPSDLVIVSDNPIGPPGDDTTLSAIQPVGDDIAAEAAGATVFCIYNSNGTEAEDSGLLILNTHTLARIALIDVSILGASVSAFAVSGTGYVYFQNNVNQWLYDDTGALISTGLILGGEPFRVTGDGTKLYCGQGDITVFDISDIASPTQDPDTPYFSTDYPDWPTSGYGGVSAFDMSSDGLTLYTIDQSASDVTALQVEFSIWHLEEGGGGGGGTGGPGDASGTICVWTVDIETLVSAAYLIPFEAGTIGKNGRACSSAGFVYFTDDSTSKVWILDVRNPQNPKYVGNFSIAGAVKDMDVCGYQLYLALGDAHCSIFDITYPADPLLVATFGDGSFTSVWGNTEWLLLVDTSAGELFVYDISDPVSPTLAVSASGFSGVADVIAEGTIIYLTDLNGTLWVVEFVNNEGSAYDLNTIIDGLSVKGLGGIDVADGQIFGANGDTVGSAQLVGEVATGEDLSGLTANQTSSGPFAGTDSGGNVIPSVNPWTTGKPVAAGKYLVVGAQSSGEYAVAIFDVGGFTCPSITTGSVSARKINSARISTDILDASGLIITRALIAHNGIAAYESASDPTTSDILEGRFAVWYNSGSGDTKLWANIGGVLKSVLLT